jgi:hypothetical protein
MTTEEAQNQIEVMRNHMKDVVDIYRVPVIVGADGRKSEGSAVLINQGVPCQWINRHTFTIRTEIGFMPDPKHDSSDEMLFPAQVKIYARDYIIIKTNDSTSNGQWLTVTSEPEPYKQMFNLIRVILRWTDPPAGVS